MHFWWVNYVDIKMFGEIIKLLLPVFKTCRKRFPLAQRHSHHTSEYIVHCTLKVLVKIIQCILNVFFYWYKCEDYYYTIYPFMCLTTEKGQRYTSGKSGGRNCVLIILSPETLPIQPTENFEVLRMVSECV